MKTKNDVKERKVTITRIFNAPREMVFKAWTDPKQMEQWWGPYGFTSSDCKMDIKPNGKWQIRMDAPQMGFNNLWTKGVFKEIVEPEKLVLTNEGSAGDGEAFIKAINTVTFEEHNGKTKLTLEIVVTYLAQEWQSAYEGMEQGWSQSLEKLATLFTKN
jgi:uncharacterized protein YndB with AHSA1/START domain